MTGSTERRGPFPDGRLSGGRMPDFFVVGHPKSGTTALYEMLRGHRQVFMPELKEPRFFAGDMYSREHARPAAGLPRTLEEYAALFAPAGAEQLAGEASPLYLSSRLAASEIAAHAPDARVIAILREPASFVRSLHMQFVQSHVETANDLRKAMWLEDARRAGRQIPAASQFRPHVLFYSDHVRYVEQLRRYHKAFAPGQVLVMLYEDFRADNEAAVRSVLRFLQLDDTGLVRTVEANPTVRVRWRRLDDVTRAVSLGGGPLSRAVKGAVKAVAPRRVRRGALRAVRSRVVYAKPERADEELMGELRGRFKGEVVALSEYLDRDLVSLWGYDDIV